MAIEVKAYTPKELRAMYGDSGRSVSKETWSSWLRPIIDQIGQLRGKTYTPKQVEIIFNHLGAPSKEIDA